tara:strand:- start:70 stop:2559 length:2490 start_codon:yes stop_codon:yes gene_type:complete
MLIKGSLQFNESVETYLTRTPGSDGNRRTFTVSCWYRKTTTDSSTQVIFFAGPDGDDTYPLTITSENLLRVSHYQGGFTFRLVGPKVRDMSSWMHLVCAFDTTQGTASNRIKLYVNGTQITDFSTAAYPSQNYDTSINKVSTIQRIGFQHSANAFELDGYLTEFNFIDGQQLDPSYFGYDDPLTGTWRPKKFDISSTPGGSWGTCGFYLPMDGSGATVGSDQSGQGNDWTLTNLSSANVCAQSPSGIVYSGKQRHGGSATYNNSRLPANYCTLDRNNMGGSLTLKDAATEADSSNVANVMGTHVIPPNSGKYYWECKVLNTMAGVIGISSMSVANIGNLSDVPSIRGYGADGNKYYGNTGSSYGSAFSHSGWIGVLFDSDARTLEFLYNGVSQGVAFTAGTNGIVDDVSYAPCFHLNSMDLDKVNFGANYAYGTTAWSTVPPEGYKTLCDASLSQSTGIVRADQNVGITTWRGQDRLNTRSALSFRPDCVWIKKRSGGSDTNHVIFDTVRGFASAGNGRYIIPNNTEVQDAGALLTDFTRNGFAISNNDLVGADDKDYVAWCWKAGGDNNTFNLDGVGYASFAASGTPAGATTPTGTSINTKAGFSIIKFTPTSGSGTATVPHGLGRVPKFIMMKSLTNTYNWDVYHRYATAGGNGRLILNQNTSGPDTSNNPYSQVAPTKDVFTFNNAFYADATDDVICYCWADIPGFSQFGIYKGNGNTDGPFINTGFRPAIIWYKDRTSGGYWNIRDDVRTPFNGDAHELYTATNEMEDFHPDTYGYDPRQIDFFSNGFKIRSSNSAINDSSRQYVYMCWARNSSNSIYGGQANAR